MLQTAKNISKAVFPNWKNAIFKIKPNLEPPTPISCLHETGKIQIFVIFRIMVEIRVHVNVVADGAGVQFSVVSVVQRLHVFWRKDPYAASTAPSPGQRARAVQQVDDVTTQEVEVGGLRGSVVAEGVSQTRFLHKDRAQP